MSLTRSAIASKLARKFANPSDLAAFLRFKFGYGNEYPYADLVDVIPGFGATMARFRSARMDLERPIFIAGLRRAGTTLFYRILHAHSGVFLFNERFPGIGLNGLGEPSARNIWSIVDADAFHDAMLPYINPLHTYRHQRWGAKLNLELAHPDPGSVAIDGLEQVLAAFPQSRILGIARDPRDFVLSAMKRAGQDEDWWVAEYLEMSILFQHLLRDRPENFVFIRYEDLTATPEAVVQRCCEFADLVPEPGMLDPANWPGKGPLEYANSSIVPVTPKWLGSDATTRERADRIWRRCERAAIALGYTEEASA